MTDGRATTTGPLRRWMLRLGRRIRQWRGTAARCRVQIRTEREEYGGWSICPHVIQPGDLVYSFDRGSDLQVERALLREYGARVYIFDPDPAVAARAGAAGLLDEFRLYALRVGGEDRPAVPGAGPESSRVIRLASLMGMFGHRRVDLIKLDEEGARAAIGDLVEMDVDVRQLLVALPATATTEERDRVESLVETLQGHGYRIFHITPDGRRYSFIRTDFPDT